MMKRLALLATLAAFGVAGPTLALAQGAPYGQPGPDSLGADWGPQQDDARAGVKQGRYVPLFQVLNEIRRRTPGHQLDAGLEQSGTRAVYRVRWATNDGRRIDYIADAQTGAILSAK